MTAMLTLNDLPADVREIPDEHIDSWIDVLNQWITAYGAGEVPADLLEAYMDVCRERRRRT